MGGIYVNSFVMDKVVQDIELLGQTNSSTTNSLEQPTYSTSSNGAYGFGLANSGYSNLYALKFMTPDFEGVSSKITFNLYISASNGSYTRYCGISKSLDNLSLYFHQGYEADKNPAYYDENMIAHTTFCDYNRYGTVYTIEMLTDKLEPNTIYYFTIYATDGADEYISNTVSTVYPISSHTAAIETIPGTGSYNNVLHKCYVDNGTSWDLYAPYIDNGTIWEEL